LVINSSDAPNKPTISSVGGAVGDGQQITISGSIFGTGPNVVLFDDFNSGTDGNTISSTAVVGSWSTAVGKVFADDLLSGGKGMRVVDVDQLSSVVTFTATDEVFISFIGYVPDGYYFPYATAEETYPDLSSLKSVWLMYTGVGYAHYDDPDVYLCSWGGSHWYTVSSNDTPISSFDTANACGWLWDTPIRWSFWAKGNGMTVAGSDGMFQTTNGIKQINRCYTEYKAWFAPTNTTYAWDRINFVGYIRTTTGTNFVEDDIYVATGDNAQARVEIGNAATYTECTRLTLVTTGAAGDSWDSDEITATIREGTFTQAELENGYLYVINGDGCVNEEGFDMTAVTAAATGDTSSQTWQSWSFESQTGTFTASCDVTPDGNSVNGVVALADGAPTAYSENACQVRFYNNVIDARDGGAYAGSMSFTSGTKYHIRMVVDVSAKTYDVFVTPNGGSETQLADDFDFRTDLPNEDDINHWALYSAVVGQSLFVQNRTIE
jgi:hypothetical protein